MPSKITDTAQMLCNKGSKPAQIKVTSQCFKYVGGHLVATEKDKQAIVNIPAFGACSITKKDCVPCITMWEQTSIKNTINEQKILLENSTCQCQIGGKITFNNNGHNINAEIV